MAIGRHSIPEITFNGKKLDELINHCKKVVITKEINNIDVIELQAIGEIETPSIDTNFIYLTLVDFETGKKLDKKYRLIEVVENDI